MIKLYDYLESGNGYKARLILTLLGLPFERIELDIVQGATRTPEFLKINPNGRIPTVVLDDGRVLAESNAILWYFAEGTRFLPADRFERAQVLQWLCFEQYSHEPNIATVRFWVHIARDKEKPEQTADKRKLGIAALGVMESHLKGKTYFVGERYSIADIALYAYTHVAHEGGFDLAPYPAIRAWLDRVAREPGHIPITKG
jgi:glutathione S-transferase